jgi:hypothetical protein
MADLRRWSAKGSNATVFDDLKSNPCRMLLQELLSTNKAAKRES